LESENSEGGRNRSTEIDRPQSMSWMRVHSPRLFPGLGIALPDQYRDFYLMVLGSGRETKPGKTIHLPSLQSDVPGDQDLVLRPIDIWTPYVLILESPNCFRKTYSCLPITVRAVAFLYPGTDRAVAQSGNLSHHFTPGTSSTTYKLVRRLKSWIRWYFRRCHSQSWFCMGASFQRSPQSN
jgi:hypothetical protein